MAENNWALQDGRAILVEFEAAQAEANWGWFGFRSSGEGLPFETAPTESAWGWFGMRGSGEGIEFAAASSPWSEQDWLSNKGMLMAAEAGGGGPPICVRNLTMLGA